jgi:hypothetical protein
MLRAKDGENVSLQEESIWSHSQHYKIGNTLTHNWLSVSPATLCTYSSSTPWIWHNRVPTYSLETGSCPERTERVYITSASNCACAIELLFRPPSFVNRILCLL